MIPEMRTSWDRIMMIACAGNHSPRRSGLWKAAQPLSLGQSSAQPLPIQLSLSDGEPVLGSNISSFKKKKEDQDLPAARGDRTGYVSEAQASKVDIERHMP